MNTLPESRLIPAAGWLWVIGAVLAIVFMLHHPSTSSHGTAEMLAELRDEGMLSAWVHGLLIVVMMGWWLAAYGLTIRLGHYHLLPVMGLQMFSVGIFGYSLAAIASGFVAPEIAETFAGTSAAQMEQGRNLLRISWEFNQIFANIGLIGTSVAILVWGCALIRRAGIARVAGVLGVFAGAVPILLLLSGYLHLDVAGMTSIVVLHCAWYLIIGVQILWGPLRDSKQ